MFCGKCGNELKPGAKFCPKCGNAVTPVQNFTPVQEVSAEFGGGTVTAAMNKAKQKLSKGKKVMIGAAAALVLIIVIAAVGSGGNSEVNDEVSNIGSTGENGQYADGLVDAEDSSGLGTTIFPPEKGTVETEEEAMNSVPNNLPQGEIWDYVSDWSTLSNGYLNIDPHYIIPVYRCTKEVLDEAAVWASEHYNSFNYVYDEADLFSPETEEALRVCMAMMSYIWDSYISITTTWSGVVSSSPSGDGSLLLVEKANKYEFNAGGLATFCNDELFAIVDSALSDISIANAEDKILDLYIDLLSWYAQYYPMQISRQYIYDEIPTGQWVSFDPHTKGDTIFPETQLYVQSIEGNTITFTAIDAHHSYLDAHDGETNALDDPITIELIPVTDYLPDLVGTFTYTDTWGNVFEGQFTWNGSHISISTTLIEYGPDYESTSGLSGSFYPVGSIIG